MISHLNLDFKIEGTYRQSSLEIPPRAIRELIINAVLHRSYINSSDILIAIYDDRVEIVSPGGLLRDLDFKTIKTSPGTSKSRNKALANVFYRMNFVENWGSGIPRSLEEVKKAGIDDIDFIDNSSYVSVIIPRKRISSSEEKSMSKDSSENNHDNELSSNEALILDLIRENSKITQSQIALELNLSKRQVQRFIQKLKVNGFIERIGNNQTGSWKILLEEPDENE